MGGWIAGGVILALLLLLMATKIQVRGLWQGTLSVYLQVGPLKWMVYPMKKGSPEPKEEKEEKPAEQQSERVEEEHGPNRRQVFYTLETIPPILMKALGRLRQRLVVDPLDLSVTFGGEDPADTAILCGRCQALAGALLPWMEQVLTIRNLSVRLQVDFEADHTQASGELGVRLRVLDLLVLLFGSLGGLLGWYRGYQKLGTPDQKKDKQARAA